MEADSGAGLLVAAAGERVSGLALQARAARDAVTKGDPRRALGLLFILAVAVIWVAASFLVQQIEEEGLDPLLLTYIANSLFAICLPVYFVQRSWTRRCAGSPRQLGDDEEAASLVGRQLTARTGAAGAYTISQTMRAALVVAPCWFLAQFSFNTSLHATSVTSNTILSSASSLFTFALSVWLLREPYSSAKLASILVCMAGIAGVTLGDSKAGAADGSSSAGGDLLAVLSALLYAVYTLAIRLQLPDDDKVSVTLFFGFVGLINLLAVAPIVAAAHWLGLLDLSALTQRALGLTLAKGLFDNVLSDVLWARAVLLVGPTVATVGLSVQVPFAIVADVIFKSPGWLRQAGTALLVLGGGCLVLAGFFGINLASGGSSSSARQGEEEKGGAGPSADKALYD